MPHPTSWKSFLILSFHQRLGFPTSLLPLGYSTKTLYAPLLSPIRATCPAHPSLLDFLTQMIFGEEYRAYSSLLRKHSTYISENMKVRQLIYEDGIYSWY
jgi:hypothetical protein